MGLTTGRLVAVVCVLVGGGVLGGCASRPPADSPPAVMSPPPPPPISIAAEPAPPPALERTGFDAGLLGMSFAIQAGGGSSAAVAGEVSTLSIELSRPTSDPQSPGRTGILEVQTAQAWLASALAAAPYGSDPPAALIDTINDDGDIDVESLPPATLGEGYAMVLRVRPQRLTFATGVGIRHLAAFTDEYAPLTDADLYYVFEGLTQDGRYHVLLRLPVAAEALPSATEPGTLENAVEFAEISDAYVVETAASLERAASASFRPSLERLDEFARSIDVR